MPLVVPLEALTGADIGAERAILRLSRRFGPGPHEPDPATLPLLPAVVDRLRQAVVARPVLLVGPLSQPAMERIAARVHPEVRALSSAAGATIPAGEALALPPAALDGSAVWQALRPHHWVKNLLVFVPLLAAHRWDDAGAWMQAALAFLAFCLASATVYLTNDLFDIPDDRAHPVKRLRPLASGRLRPRPALGLASGTLAFGLVLAGLVGVAGVLALYVAASLAYSARIKALPGLDVAWLVGLYALRLLAGGGSTGIEVSGWLLAYGACVFGSLALAKRCAELGGAASGALPVPRRRGYRVGQRRVLAGVGLALAAGSLAVLALYLHLGAAALLYDRPGWLALGGVVVLGWLGRVWGLTLGQRMPGDPIVFALRDPASLTAGASVLVLLVLAAAG